MSSVDIKICHKGIQAMDTLLKYLLDDLTSLIWAIPDENGHAIEDHSLHIFRPQRRPFKLLVPRLNVQIQNEVKGAGNSKLEEELVQLVLMEYLSHVACFKQAPEKVESSHLARTVCVERIRSMGLTLSDALTLTTAVKSIFMEELELTEKSWNSQRKLLIQLATESSSFSFDSPRDRVADKSEADMSKNQFRLSYRRSQSDSNLSNFGLTPEDEPTDFTILEETIALCVRQAMRSRHYFFTPLRASLDIAFLGGLILSKDCDGCLDSYHGTISSLSIQSKASSILQILNIDVSSKIDFLTCKVKLTASFNSIDISFSTVNADNVMEIISPIKSVICHSESESGSSRSSTVFKLDIMQISVARVSLLFFRVIRCHSHL
jgi:hypothetical protein